MCVHECKELAWNGAPGRALPCPAVPGARPGCRTPLPGHKVRSGGRVGSGTRRRWGSAAGCGGLALPAFPPAVSALGPCSGRPGEEDTGERDRGVAGSPHGTGSLGRPGNRAGPGAGLGSSSPGRGYPWGGAARAPERTGSRGEEPGCGAGIDRAGGWVGASSLPPRRRPRLSRGRTRVLAPPPPRAAPGGAVAPRFRCKAGSRGSPRTARNEGGAGHSAPRRPAEPRGAHRTSSGGGNRDPEAEGWIWGQMGRNGVCRGGTRPRRAGAVPESALSPGTPGAGPGPGGAGGGGRGMGASGPSPAESPWGALAASAVDLGSVGGGPCPGSAPAPGGPAGREGPPPRCRPRARGTPGPLRQRQELPGRAGDGPARRCLVPRRRGGSVPLLLPGQDPHERPRPRPRARPRPGGPGRAPTLRWSLPAGFPAPFSFASRLLPAPPHRNRGPGLVRVPRGSQRGVERFPPLVPARRAVGAAASPLSAPTRGCGGPQSRVALLRRWGRGSGFSRELRGPTGLPGGVSAGGLGAGTVLPACAGGTGSRGAGQTLVSLGCSTPAPTEMGPARPRGAAADAAPGAPNRGARRGAVAPSAREDDPHPIPAPPGWAPGSPFCAAPSRERGPGRRAHANSRAAPRPALINND